VSRWEKVEMKSLLITIGGFLVLGNFLPCVVLAKEKQEKILTGAITLFQAQQTVLLRNPDLQAFSYEVKAREAKTLQASLLPNPKLNVSVENVADSGDFNGLDQSETTVQLSQQLAMGDKRNLRRYSANLSKEIAEWDYEVQRLEVLTSVSKSFTHVLKVQQRIILTGEGVQLAKKFLNTVSKRVKTGKFAVIEKIKAQVTLAHMHMKKNVQGRI
jgi:outer membrane protein, heavy metal efflux system